MRTSHYTRIGYLMALFTERYTSPFMRSAPLEAEYMVPRQYGRPKPSVPRRTSLERRAEASSTLLRGGSPETGASGRGASSKSGSLLLSIIGLPFIMAFSS